MEFPQVLKISVSRDNPALFILSYFIYLTVLCSLLAHFFQMLNIKTSFLKQINQRIWDILIKQKFYAHIA
jgi:hypothetical protein